MKIVVICLDTSHNSLAWGGNLRHILVNERVKSELRLLINLPSFCCMPLPIIFFMSSDLC